MTYRSSKVPHAQQGKISMQAIYLQRPLKLVLSHLILLLPEVDLAHAVPAESTRRIYCRSPHNSLPSQGSLRDSAGGLQLAAHQACCFPAQHTRERRLSHHYVVLAGGRL